MIGRGMRTHSARYAAVATPFPRYAQAAARRTNTIRLPVFTSNQKG